MKKNGAVRKVVGVVDGFEIERGIPIPPPGFEPRHSHARFPLGQIRPGDSFVIQKPTSTTRTTLAVSARRAKVKISIRQLRESDSLRVWRVR